MMLQTSLYILLLAATSLAAPAPKYRSSTTPAATSVPAISTAPYPSGTGAATTSSPVTTPSATPSTTPPSNSTGSNPSGHSWKSGAGQSTGGGVAKWRGTALDIASTWADDDESNLNFWQLHDGGDYQNWQLDLVMSVGAFDSGTWADAASGKIDDHWTQSLTKLASLWNGRPGQMYIRFAAEWNGDWNPWSVPKAQSANFVTAWKRYRSLQQKIFPSAKLAFAINRNSAGALGMAWTELFPGKEYADLIDVDYYNMGDGTTASSIEEFNQQLTQKDQWGAPVGLQAHLDFAKSVGVPLGIGEWNGKAEDGDYSCFVDGMYQFFQTGEVLYENVFAVATTEGGNFELFPDTRMPNVAAQYSKLF